MSVFSHRNCPLLPMTILGRNAYHANSAGIFIPRLTGAPIAVAYRSLRRAASANAEASRGQKSEVRC
jgi:hypothetical protein